MIKLLFKNNKKLIGTNNLFAFNKETALSFPQSLRAKKRTKKAILLLDYLKLKTLFHQMKKELTLMKYLETLLCIFPHQIKDLL